MSKPNPQARVAIVLAAGVGQRLMPLTSDRPKALVSVGDKTILGRAVETLVRHGVTDLVIATGYLEAAVREAMSNCPIRVTYRNNPFYASTQNSMSLLACADAVVGRAFYKLDGDVLFHPAVLERIDEVQDADLVVAVDTSSTLGPEEMKVQRSGQSRIVGFGKGLEPGACWGESIGIELIRAHAGPRLFDSLGRAKASGRVGLYYEDVYSQLIDEGMTAEGVDTSDLGWTEVDCSADLDRARALVAMGAFGDRCA